jgi:hypothetical protein
METGQVEGAAPFDDLHSASIGARINGIAQADAILAAIARPTLTTPYSRSIVLVKSSGDNQDGIERSSLINYVNPDNTSSEVTADQFFSGVDKVELKKNDIIHATLSDGFFVLQMETDTKAIVRFS